MLVSNNSNIPFLLKRRGQSLYIRCVPDWPVPFSFSIHQKQWFSLLECYRYHLMSLTILGLDLRNQRPRFPGWTLEKNLEHSDLHFFIPENIFPSMWNVKTCKLWTYPCWVFVSSYELLLWKSVQILRLSICMQKGNK